MKKLMTLIFVVLSVSLLADWQKINDVQDRPATKDWVYYDGTPTYTYTVPDERAVYFDADDFGMEYPIELSGIQWYFNQDGVNYNYKVYSKDGTTVVYTSADSLSAGGYQVTWTDSAIVLSDDFWVALVPQADGTPQTIHDGGDGVFGHSFHYDVATSSWEPLYGGGYNHSMAVNIIPHVGDDLYPPTARGILGNETFMDQDAKISIRIIDQSAVVSPVVGEYSFDGGTTWTPFNLTESKSTYVFGGIIPGQSDGTVGVVRFNMADVLGYAAVSDEFDISWGVDLPILFEGFENVVFPANGWTLNTTGAGFIEGTVENGDKVHTGSKSAVHLDDSGPQDDWLISPLVSLPAANPSTLTFWQYGDWLNYVTTGYHEIAVSTDMVTWDVIHTGHPDGGPTGLGRVWDFMSLSLLDYIGQNVYIGFRFVGNYEDIWYIDDIEILYDYEAPVVEDLMGNPVLFDTDSLVGAYLNNPMVLNLDVYDLSGVDTVVGHYTFDGGVTVVDIDFAQAKGTEQWTATIPAMDVVTSGTINFDLTDIGGLATLTADYNIDFALDTAAPIFTYVTGTEVFVGNPMDLTIVFTDESAITSCVGSYSKDGFVTSYDFTLTPAKVNNYTYAGTIPAEALEVLNGEVKFSIKDAEDQILTTDAYTVKWTDGQVEWFEDFESGAGNWTLGGNWALVEESEYTSATFALTESPGGDYLEDEISSVTLAADRDWSTYFGAKISFWAKYDIEAGFDYMYFDVTTNAGVDWTNLKVWDGNVDWHEENISLDAFVGGDFNFRFRFESDGGAQENGMYIDDISLITYNIDHAAPLAVYAPYEPDFYEGALGDYTNNVDVLDNSGVSAVGVLWSADGAAQTNIAATFVAGDQWEFTIPAQASGTIVEYSFWAQDASVNSNEGVGANTYTIVCGDHRVYDADIVNWYNTIEDGNGDAKVVKITVGASDATTTYAADLSYLLYRMYADPSHQSDPMTVRVWQDDGTGQPGVEVIAPIELTPAANAAGSDKIEMIDLRSYGLRVYGDFWIGYSSEIGIVYGTSEEPVENGTTAYERSYNGTDDGSGGWTWELFTGYNYLMRAVLGESVGIEENNMPLTTSLEQNYPNPFNPTTTINFTIANEAKVSLVVYDVMGRTVAKLVDGNLSQGAHKVSFDASSMVSGVYYYNLKAGNVNQTKKMMLIK